MRKVVSILLLLVFAISLFGCAAPVAPAKSEDVKATPTAAQPTPDKSEGVKFDGKVILGATAPLTGANQMVGEYYTNGMKMAVEEINAAGGILGKELVLQVEDEGEDQSIALNATIKLISEGVPAIVGSYFSTNCMAVLPEVAKAKVPYFANGSNANISAQKNEYCWQIRVTDDFIGPIMADVAVKTLNMKNPAVFYTTAASTTALAEAYIAGMEELGVPVDKKNVYGAPESETNFSAIINQIMASDVDGLVCMGVSEAWDIPFAQQLYSAGFDKPLLGSLSFSNAAFIKAAGEAGNGWNSITDFSPNIQGVDFEVPERTLEFASKYEELYGTKPVPQAAWGYDCVYLFKEACERAGTTTDREKINAAMAKTDMQGANNYYKVYEDTFHVMSTYVLVTTNEDGLCIPWNVINFR